MKLQCKRCKISWIPRIEGRPKWCPSCHSPYWDKDRVRGVVVAVEPVKVSRVLVSKPAAQVPPVIKATACKCGATGVMIVGGKKKCAACGRDLGA